MNKFLHVSENKIKQHENNSRTTVWSFNDHKYKKDVHLLFPKSLLGIRN